MNRRLAPALLLILAAPMARGDAIDDLVAVHMKARQIPGLSLAVIRDGRVVKAKGYGLADVEQDVPATEETVYELGSITKQFTAEAVMMLVEEGEIGLDDPIRKHLPDLPEAWKGVTVRHLLNHTSGIVSYTGVTDFLKLARTDQKPEEILALVRDRKAEFAPGASWSYNNTGYYLLGLLIEKASGERYPSFLKERIFRPLGMDRTRPSDPRRIVPHRARGYGRFLGVLQNRDPIAPGAAFSAGFLLSTVGDMAKWDAALSAGKFLRSSSYEAMYTPAKLTDGATRPYGFGWAVGSTLGHRILEHGGGTAGFSTLIRRYPDDGLTIILLTNLAGESPSPLATKIARQQLPALIPSPIAAKDDPDPKRTEALREAFEAILAGKPDKEALTPEFAKFLETPAARASIRSMGAGKVEEFSLLSAKGPTREYRARVGPGTFTVRFTLDDRGKIAGLLGQKEE